MTATDGTITTLSCDLLAMSGGWNPTIHLATHLGAAPAWDDTLAAFVPGRLPPGMTVVGAAAGKFALADCLVHGAEAGGKAAMAAGLRVGNAKVPEVEPEKSDLLPLWQVRNSRGKAFVDFQNDVSTGNIQLAEREGYRSVEHLRKRCATLGMATNQGKTSNVNGVALMWDL